MRGSFGVSQVLALRTAVTILGNLGLLEGLARVGNCFEAPGAGG